MQPKMTGLIGNFQFLEPCSVARGNILHTPSKWMLSTARLFVCVEVLRPSQPNGVMSSVVSLPNHTFTGQA